MRKKSSPVAQLLGDYVNVIIDINKNHHITRFNYVYFPATQSLYFVGVVPKNIRKVESYHKLLFGVLK